LKGAKSEAPPSNTGAVSYELGDSMNIRLLIHYVGDIHQPLHATSRYTSKYPSGDRGGNSFTLTKVDDISNLHSLWDSALHQYSNDLVLPLSTTDWTWLGDQAEALTQVYPESHFSDLHNDYTKWDDESLAIAESFVYTNINENTVPSDAYLAQGVIIAEEQIVKAGYRLAIMFESMWGVSAVEEPRKTNFL